MLNDNFHSRIVHQVFPDRFSIGDKRTVQEKIAEGLYPAEAIPKDWDHPGSAIHSIHF